MTSWLLNPNETFLDAQKVTHGDPLAFSLEIKKVCLNMPKVIGSKHLFTYVFIIAKAQMMLNLIAQSK